MNRIIIFSLPDICTREREREKERKKEKAAGQTANVKLLLAL